MASTDATPQPIKAQALRITFPLWLTTGLVNSGASGLDSEVSLDAGTFADCTNEATEIASSSGTYCLDLTSGEMTADTVAIQVKSSTTNAITAKITIYPNSAGKTVANATMIGGQTASASGTITFPNATLASTTNITAGTITTVGTVTTVTNQLTAAAIATGVWQDATGGDFTVSSSIGKSLYTSGVIPGASGGILIAGSNADTSFDSITLNGQFSINGALAIVGNFTVGGTTTWTGAVTFAGGLTSTIAGDITGSIGGNLVGNVGGNVAGSVGSVAGGVGGDVAGSVGSIAGITFPTHFSTLAITVGGAVTVGTLAAGSIATATFAAGATIPRVTLADTLTAYTGNTPQTGDSYARIGTTGSGLTSLAPSATALSTAVWTNTIAGRIDVTLSTLGTSAQLVKVLAAIYDSLSISGSTITLSNGHTMVVTTTGRVTS